MNFENCSGIISNTEEIENEQTLIYPNPFTSFLNIQVESSSIEKIVIHDKLGKNIIEVYPNENSESWIELDHVENGLYFLQIINRSGHSRSLKIIKN